MKIGFYYENQGLPKMNLTRPDLGNPGVGGTQYCFILLIYYLRQYKPEWDLVVYLNNDSIFPSGVSKRVVKGYCDLIAASETDKCDFLVIKSNYNAEFITAIERGNQSVITWGHNYYLSPLADFIAKCDNIVANVFVGKQQYDRYIDHDIILKSTYIFNMLNDPFPQIERTITSPIVVYMGALIPAKGFHLLARIWTDILKECPAATLKVLGAGNLYSRDSTLGPLGIADVQYEKSFMPYITDHQGQLLPSVEFLGVVGQEKYDIFKTASVGVVNPSARTETFGMGIIEMAFCELPVVTLGINGHPDTIINGETGCLEKNLTGIKNSIVKLLNTPRYNVQLGKEAKKRANRVAPENILPSWIDLFESLYSSAKANCFRYHRLTKPYSNNLKWLRYINRFFRFKVSLKFLPSILHVETLIHNKLYK